MKRYISSKYNLSELYEFNIDIVESNSEVSAESILDTASPEYFDFETSVLDIFEMHEFNLEDAYQSNNDNSVSQYYIYTKLTDDGTKLRILVKLRISDHDVPDRTFRSGTASGRQLAESHTKHLAENIAKTKYNQSRGYRPRTLDIIFDDNHFVSYESALRYLEDRLDEIDPE